MSRLALARAALAVLLVATGALWGGALLSSARPSPPALLVYGEPVARRGATWPVRVLAVWVSERRTAPLEGSVVVEGQRFPLEQGVARVALPPEGHEATVVVEGAADGAPVRVEVAVQLARTWPAGRPLRYEPWTREIAPGGALATSGPPLYPVTGSAPAMLPTSVLVLGEAGVEIVPRAPNAAGVAMSDGRVLRADPSVVVVEVPPAARPGAEIEATLAFAFEPPTLHLELLVNGIVRDVRVVSGAERARVRFVLPGDVAAGWFAVRASPSPLASVPSAHAIGVLLEDGDPEDPAAVLRQIARQAGFRDGRDPLLRHLLEAPPADVAPLRALLGRLRLDDRRALNLAPPAREQAAHEHELRAAAVARFRAPFRLSGALFALLAALVALSSARAGQRWQDESEDAPARGRRLPSLGWALLAFAASLSALWVLDWALGLMLGMPLA